jgi:hypothetical protein
MLRRIIPAIAVAVALNACGGAPSTAPAGIVAQSPAPVQPQTTPVPTTQPAPTNQPVTETPMSTTPPQPSATPLPTPVGRTPAPVDGLATVEPSPAPELAVADATSQPMIDRATAQLAQKLGVAASAISLKSLESIEWPDGSLGCPQPDVMYLQVITPGYKIVLTAQGSDYVYHTDTNRQVVLCEPR